MTTPPRPKSTQTLGSGPCPSSDGAEAPTEPIPSNRQEAPADSAIFRNTLAPHSSDRTLHLSANHPASQLCQPSPSPQGLLPSPPASGVLIAGSRPPSPSLLPLSYIALAHPWGPVASLLALLAPRSPLRLTIVISRIWSSILAPRHCLQPLTIISSSSSSSLGPRSRTSSPGSPCLLAPRHPADSDTIIHTALLSSSPPSTLSSSSIPPGPSRPAQPPSLAPSRLPKLPRCPRPHSLSSASRPRRPPFRRRRARRPARRPRGFDRQAEPLAIQLPLSRRAACLTGSPTPALPSLPR
ncbi:hypothetical protein PTTG_29489 [Puccinia triticina 1-1 BBBD Race 1]|uniref:Uncharacterized protein n=1 Tax=Puccinia triticina (isolate 1-1 / race 1 (BBBD)) TaxID=630390 RepID=A0A180G3S4_PUCT1|nr:hypothetical protein PTTG_29489 [Puccinia triticina 1-1 BBBD Race 1]WAR62286.1 hypothetical protein PtB15_14B381 [Puccinia triticina]